MHTEGIRVQKKQKRPTTSERVDAYYMTHAETENASLEDLALDAVLRPSTSLDTQAPHGPTDDTQSHHVLNVLESLCIEDTLGSSPDAKTISFVRHLYGMSEELASQVAASFAFKAPLKVEFVGKSSYTTSDKVVDVAVDMPGSCFDEKDYLNHRYHAKRVLYLDSLRVALLRKMRSRAEGEECGAGNGGRDDGGRRKKRKGQVGERGASGGHANSPTRVEWATELMDPRKPYLVLETSGAPGIVFRVHASLEQKRGAWLKKCGPGAGNLRGYVSATTSLAKTTVSREGGLPTPMYNQSIVEDVTLGSTAEALASTARRFPIFADVVAMLEVWAGNHGLSVGEEHVSGSSATIDVCGLDRSFFAALVTLVLRSDDQMQYSTQRMHVFRGALQMLCGAEAKFTCPGGGAKKWGVFGSGNGRGKGGDNVDTSGLPSRNAWREAFKDGVVFVSDVNPYVNAGAWISRDVLQQARAAAASALRMLVSSPTPDAIDAIFMKKSNPVMLYDIWCTCEVRGDSAAATSTVSIAGDVSDRLGIEERVQRVAAEALGDRATLVRVLHSPCTLAMDAQGAPAAIYSSRTPVRLCCRLHPTVAMRAVDVGPPADDAAAASEFRAFWGAKSELRRFQDGKICESVFWTAGNGRGGGAGKHDVVRQLLDYIVPRHCPEVTGVDVPAMALARALEGPRSSNNSVGSSKDDHSSLYERACLNGVTKLGKVLRGLDAESVTLTIVNVQPVAAVLRNTAVFPPIPHPLAGSSLADSSDMVPRCLPAIEVLCQLEGSGKWPDAPVAYAKMKAALGVQLAQTLRSSYGMEAIASEEYVDILMEGFAYRLVLFSEREPAEAMAVIALRQAHQGLISSLAAEHPSFKHCCRLAKLWISRQCLSNHICEEATELVCAAAYTTKIGVGAECPTSPEAGFLAFLDIVAYHPWEAQPLVLDSKVTEDAARLMSRMRAIGKAPSMFVVMGSAGVTIGDMSDINKKLKCAAWTEHAPDSVILFRASVLARKSIKAIASELTYEPALSSTLASKSSFKGPSIVTNVFEHSMKDYDLVVVLRPDALVGGNQKPEDRRPHHDHRIDASYDGTSNAANAAKYCQAVLSGIPKSLVQQRGSKIKKELLVGFDPLPMFCELLREKYERVAIICANMLDGDQIGIKIKPAFCRPTGVAFDADYGCSVFRPVDGSCITNGDTVTLSKEAFAQDILELGSGIVDSVSY